MKKTNIYIELIRYLTIHGPTKLSTLSSIFHLKEERIQMYIYKGINEGYLGKVGYENDFCFLSKFKN